MLTLKNSKKGYLKQCFMENFGYGEFYLVDWNKKEVD